jgi:hypothetical protein
VSSGTSDCELRDDWLLEQDVNAWSSLAYVAAGLLLAWEVRRGRLPRAVYGLAGIAIAEGSAACCTTAPPATSASSSTTCR